MTAPNQDRGRQPAPTIRFSTTYGKNLELQQHGKFTVWKFKKHCGICFTNKSLPRGENLKFKLDGSGHVLLGLVYGKPDPQAIQDVDATVIEPNGHWTHFRFKKETTSVSLSRVKAREITFTRGSKGSIETKTIAIQNKDLYVFFEIQFGDLYIDIESEDRKRQISFDRSCGINVSLEINDTRARLKNSNISAICCTDRPLATGEVIDLNINPVDNANWTYANIFVSNKNANELEIQKLETSLTTNSNLYPRKGIKVDKRGTIQLRQTENGEISYCIKTEQKKMSLVGTNVDLTMPLFLYVELFRVRVGIESTLPEAKEDTYLRTQDLQNATYLTATADADADADEAKYLEPQHQHDDVMHPYTKLDNTTRGFRDMASIGDLQSSLPPPQSPSDTKGYIKMYPPQQGGLPDFTDQDTQPKQLSDDDSLTMVKQRNAAVAPTTQVLPRGVVRDTGRPPVPQHGSEEAEASGPVQAPPIPPRRSIGSSGPECRYVNELGVIPVQQASLSNVIARVQILEETTGSTRPAESPVGTFGEVEMRFAELIRKNYVELMTRLDPDPLADYLYQEGQMSNLDHMTFLECDSRTKRRQILELLQARPTTKGIFITAMQNSFQTDILDFLRL